LTRGKREKDDWLDCQSLVKRVTKELNNTRYYMMERATRYQEEAPFQEPVIGSKFSDKRKNNQGDIQR